MVFQGCSSEHAEVQSFLEVLTILIQKRSEPLDAQAVGNALFGLSRMRTDHVLPLLNHVLSVISSYDICFTFSTLSETELVALSHGTAAGLQRKGVDMCLCDDKRILLSRINCAVSDELSRRPWKPSGSQIERDLLQCALHIFKDDPDVSVNATGSFLFGFEADIVMISERRC